MKKLIFILLLVPFLIEAQQPQQIGGPTTKILIPGTLSIGKYIILGGGFTFSTLPSPSSCVACIAWTTDSLRPYASNGISWLSMTAGDSVNHIPAFYNYPAQNPIGTIIDESSWPQNDAHWGLLGGNASISFTGALPTLTSTTNAWTNTVAYLPDRPTLLSNWQDSVWWKLTSAPNASNFFGTAILSNNTHVASSYKTYINTSSGAMAITNNAGTTLISGSGPTMSLNDNLLFSWSLNDSVLSFSCKNITTNSATTTITTNDAGATHLTTALAGPFIPNNANWGFLLSGTGTYQIQRIKISSNATRYPNVLIAGSSHAICIGANSFATSFPETLGATWPTIDRYAAGAGTSDDMINLMPEINMINAPTIIWMGEGPNNLRYGASEAATENSVQSMINKAGGNNRVQYISIIPEDSTQGGQGTALLRTWMATKMTGAIYIDLAPVLAGGTNIILAKYSAADHVHGNQLCYSTIDSIYRAQGIIGPLNPSRRSAFKNYAQDIVPHGDSLSFNFRFDRRADRIPMVDDSGNIVSTPWKYTGGFMTFSTNQTTIPTPIGSSGVVINSQLIMNGNTSAMTFQDRTTPANYHSLYENNNFLVFDHQGSDLGHINSNGDFDFNNTGLGYNPVAFGGIYVQRTKTIASNAMTKGGSFTSDSTTRTWTGTGPIPEAAAVKILSDSLTVPGSAIAFNRTEGLYVEAPRPGGTAIFHGNRSIVAVGDIYDTLGTIRAFAPTTTIPSINLPAGTSPTSPNQGDLWPILGQLNYRDQGTTYNLISNKLHTIFTPTNGATVTTVNNQENIINPSGTLATLTLALPSSPANNDKITFTSTQVLSTITYSGGTVVGGLTTTTAGRQWWLTFDSGTSTWY